MAVIESKKIPITYNETTTTGSNVSTNKTLYTEFDTELKKTFVYDNAFTLGSRKPLATIDTSGKVTPFQENGNFIASQSLRTALTNDQFIKNTIQASTRNAVRDYIGLNDPSLIRGVTNLEIDKLMGTTASASTAAAPPPPPPQGGNPSPQPDPTGTQPASPSSSTQTTYTPDDPVKDRTNVRPDYGGHIYPLNFGGDQDYVKFTMYRYKPKGFIQSNSITDGINPPGSTNKVVSKEGKGGGGKGYVILPIQSPASDTNSVGWGDGRLTGVEAALFNVAQSGIFGGLEEGVKKAGGFVDEVLKDPSNQYKNSLGLFFAQQAAQVNDVFARATGGILNPNLELLFQAPELRSFNFTFKLSARDKEEAEMIRRIIRFFKQGMSVKKAGSALFLKSPDIFDIGYYRGGQLHKSLNRFKTCALKGFNVDYTPLGSYMTYNDAAATMVAYTISMQFQEIDPIYDDDYKMADDEIGF